MQMNGWRRQANKTYKQRKESESVSISIYNALSPFLQVITFLVNLSLCHAKTRTAIMHHYYQ